MPRIKLPSPAMSISLLALFVALGGTGYAAVKINGKNIKTRTIAGTKVKNNTLTGKQIRESKLATVPKAKLATTATAAGTANALSGAAKAGFLSSAKVGTSGLVKLPMAASLAAAPRTTILVKGPFSANARCYNDGTGKQTLKVGLASTVPLSDLDEATGTANDDFITVSPSAPGALDYTLDFATLATAGGATLALVVHGGVNALGSACFVSANSLSHP